jgi:hypothetical protein
VRGQSSAPFEYHLWLARLSRILLQLQLKLSQVSYLSAELHREVQCIQCKGLSLVSPEKLVM